MIYYASKAILKINSQAIAETSTCSFSIDAIEVFALPKRPYLPQRHIICCELKFASARLNINALIVAHMSQRYPKAARRRRILNKWRNRFKTRLENE